MKPPPIALEGQAQEGQQIKARDTGEVLTIYEIASGRLPSRIELSSGYGYGTSERCTRFGEPTSQERAWRESERRRLQTGQRRRVQS